MIENLTTLSIDCGGSGLKAMALGTEGEPLSERVRIPTPYPLSPSGWVEALRSLCSPLPRPDRVTVGLPGMVRHGVVVHTPHYTRVAGPGTTVDDRLTDAWTGFHAADALADAFGVPVLAVNDAHVHAAGVIHGQGVEFVVTLGTGLGSSLWDCGRATPHLEWSHVTARKDQTIDSIVGEKNRLEIGTKRWSRRTCRILAELHPAIRWDRLFVGGGAARRLRAEDLADLCDRTGGPIEVVDSHAGVRGGVRAWALLSPNLAASARQPLR